MCGGGGWDRTGGGQVYRQVCGEGEGIGQVYRQVCVEGEKGIEQEVVRSTGRCVWRGRVG